MNASMDKIVGNQVCLLASAALEGSAGRVRTHAHAMQISQSMTNIMQIWTHLESCEHQSTNAPAAFKHRHPEMTSALCLQAAEEEHNALFAAHAPLRDRDSDALSALNALRGFQSAGPSGSATFCATRRLHATPLREMAALHKQLVQTLALPAVQNALLASQHHGASELVRIYASLRSDSVGDQSGSVSAEQRRRLRRCLLAGWPDQVARRCRSREQVTGAVALVRTCFVAIYIMFLGAVS